MIYLFYTNSERGFYHDLYTAFVDKLPLTLQERNRRHIRWQDRINHLLGQMLLMKGMDFFGKYDYWDSLKYNPYGRPYFPGEVDYNISHSGCYVLCALSCETRLGVDIEQVQHVDFGDFKETMNEAQWDIIRYSDNALNQFYRFWTIKESVVKADTRGLSVPLTSIEIDHHIARLSGKEWILSELDFHSEYQSCLASEYKSPVQIREITFDEWSQIEFGQSHG